MPPRPPDDAAPPGGPPARGAKLDPRLYAFSRLPRDRVMDLIRAQRLAPVLRFPFRGTPEAQIQPIAELDPDALPEVAPRRRPRAPLHFGLRIVDEGRATEDLVASVFIRHRAG